MIVLMGENLPHRLRHFLTAHDVRTAGYMGYAGLKNGDLLAKCEADGFDVLLTADQSIRYQNAMKGRHTALVVLYTNDANLLRKISDRILSAIDGATAGSYQFVAPPALH